MVWVLSWDVIVFLINLKIFCYIMMEFDNYCYIYKIVLVVLFFVKGYEYFYFWWYLNFILRINRNKIFIFLFWFLYYLNDYIFFF